MSKDKKTAGKKLEFQSGQSLKKIRDEPDNRTIEKFKEKTVTLSDSRGESAQKEPVKALKRKKRLQFSEGEMPVGSVQKKVTSDTLKQEAQHKVSKKLVYEEQNKRKKLTEHSSSEKVFHTDGDAENLKSAEKLKFAKNKTKKQHTIREAGKTAGKIAITDAKRYIVNNEDENAAVEGVQRLEEGAVAAHDLERHHAQKRRVKKNKNTQYQQNHTEHLKQAERSKSKQIQKQRIKREYAKAKRNEQTVGTATKGTVDYIKKIGGKVTNFFKEHRKVYLSIAAIIGMLFILMTSITSCSAIFMQNVISYAGTSYISKDEDICEAEKYYTQLEADLQERINHMESEEPGHDEYRYNIGPIEHDPFILISYLSAKYEEFTFEQVKDELDELFALQYNLELEAVNETITETTTVRVGESLGQVVTSGYCSCPICCGQWSGGPTASGVMPTANHTLAVDAKNPFVPMGTKVVMNGVEYTVEDTGAFDKYGVQFDVYYDNHLDALLHGHRTFECYLADDNGSQQVEVQKTRKVDVLNVTLNSKSLRGICSDRLSIFKKDLFDAYLETKGNLQMFGGPFEFNWYGSISSHFGYRIHPISGEKQLHNGLDIGAPAGTKVLAGLTGNVITSDYNDSYGNYVIIQDSKGRELRYAHLQSRSVSGGTEITKGDEIGLVGSTGDSTGPHLHIEYLKNGERLNPIFYLETGEGTIFGGNEFTSDAARQLLEEAEKHLGTPYVWGGYAPGGFDCSGFVSYCLTHSGVRNTGRLTAQGLYDICTPISESEAQPGDLIFFTGTYDAGVPVTHIGIYAGDGQMIHCGDPIQYTSIYSAYWQNHFYGFGRW